VWQAFRNQVHHEGLEVVTVALETAGPEACRPFIEAAAPRHPSLIDRYHRTAELFGFVNIPNGVWIDEAGIIVRPAEPAPAPASIERPSPSVLAGIEPPPRLLEILGEASMIRTNPAEYERALRDWVANGPVSRFALSPEEVVARSQRRDRHAALGQAHFELAAHLEHLGHHADAIPHYREAHRLVPSNFSYKRQAWSLEPAGGGLQGPAARFWQGPAEGQEDQWPYDGDWLSDVQAMGPENYYPEWQT
jgi:hypothetical protein